MLSDIFVILYILSKIFVRNCPKSLNFGPKIKHPKLYRPKFLEINVLNSFSENGTLEAVLYLI